MWFCPKCGAKNEDWAQLCASCGVLLESDVPNPQYDTANTVVAPSGSSKPGMLWLWLNVGLAVVALLCCGCFGVLSIMVMVLPIIGLIFGALSVSDSRNGKQQSASSHANVAKILFIVSAALFAVAMILAVIMVAVAATAGFLDLITSDWLPKD